MSKKIINTGILSFGMSGALFHAPFLNEHPGFQLTAVVERTKKIAVKSYPNIKSYDTVDQLIADRRYDSDFLAVKKVLGSGKLGAMVEAHMRYDRYRYHIGPKIAKETPVPGSGLMYDLAPHLLDAAIALFGYPLEWKKYTGQFRPKTQVDDYVHIHLVYPKGVQVFLTMSMLVVQPQAAFVLNGTKGTFVKQRTDIQEQQLLAGMNPGNALFGIEDANKYGVLTTISENGERNTEEIESVKSSYINLFEDVYKSIVEGIPYPIKEKDIIKQIEILEG